MTTKEQKVARILSGRIPIYSKMKDGGQWYMYWRCPCGDPGVTHLSLPRQIKCVVCHKIYTIFDSKSESEQ